VNFCISLLSRTKSKCRSFIILGGFNSKLIFIVAANHRNLKPTIKRA
jgi:hypothetical protein